MVYPISSFISAALYRKSLILSFVTKLIGTQIKNNPMLKDLLSQSAKQFEERFVIEIDNGAKILDPYQTFREILAFQAAQISSAFALGEKAGSKNPMYQSDEDGKNVRIIKCDNCPKQFALGEQSGIQKAGQKAVNFINSELKDYIAGVQLSEEQYQEMLSDFISSNK